MRHDHEYSLPPTGSVNDLTDRLTVYVDAFRPGWSQRVRGADEAEIVELEQLSGLAAHGLRYPDVYRRHLKLCGHDDDGLLDSLHGRMGKLRTVNQLRELYQAMAEHPEDWSGPHLPVVLGSEIGTYLAFDLQSSHQSQPAVVSEDTKRTYADSWEKLVFQHTALIRARETMQVSIEASTSPEALAEALARRGTSSAAEVLTTFATEHGFTPAWFNDTQHICLTRPGTLIWTSLSHAVFLVIAGNAEPAVHQLGEHLTSAFAATRAGRR